MGNTVSLSYQIDKDLNEKIKQRAKELKRNKRQYIEYVIEKDLEKAGMLPVLNVELNNG